MATDHFSISSSRLPSTPGSKVQLAGWEHSQTHLALFKETKPAQSQLRYHLVQDAIQGQTAPRLRLADSGTSFPGSTVKDCGSGRNRTAPGVLSRVRVFIVRQGASRVAMLGEASWRNING